MNNDKKIAFQERRIEELEKQNRDLISENKAISKENECNKALLAMKEKELSSLRESVIQMRADYSNRLGDIRLLNENLKDAIQDAKIAKTQFEKKSKSLLKKLRKYK